MKISTRGTIIAGLIVAVILAGIVSFYASSSPDGLNKVAEDKGFNQKEEGHDLDDSPLAGYETHGVDDGRLSGGVAGVAGVAITFAIGGGIALAMRRRGGRGDDTSTGSGAHESSDDDATARSSGGGTAT